MRPASVHGKRAPARDSVRILLNRESLYDHPERFPAASVPSLGLIALISWVAPAAAVESISNPFVVVKRTITQDQGDWRVDYQLRHGGPTGLILTGEEIGARVEGWVSNSRAPGHGLPRWSSLTISGAVGSTGGGRGVGRRRRGPQVPRARGVARLDGGVARPQAGSARRRRAPAGPQPAPGATFRVRLRLEHRHVVYGEYDPLLGKRAVEFWLGAASFRDVLPLEQEQYVARPARCSSNAPEDRRDTRYYTSAPDSLHLEAHVPGNQSLRFPEIPVRYSTRMRLRFRYLLAAGSEGTCQARVVQYKDTPTAWKVLPGGRLEQPLETVGRWTRVERIIQTGSDATTMALDFLISDAEAGELWIDDVSLEPLDAPPVGP